MAEALLSLIHKKRSAIIAKWFDSTVYAYAPDTAAFLKSQKDQFANPVGSSTRKGIETLLDQLLGDMHGEAIAASLDPIMRIRAVQSLSPAQATAFIFALKQILRDMFDKQLQDAGMARQFFEFEARIDRSASRRSKFIWAAGSRCSSSRRTKCATALFGRSSGPGWSQSPGEKSRRRK